MCVFTHVRTNLYVCLRCTCVVHRVLDLFTSRTEPKRLNVLLLDDDDGANVPSFFFQANERNELDPFFPRRAARDESKLPFSAAEPERARFRAVASGENWLKLRTFCL